MKILSIAAPSYNMEKYLPQCLSSLADERLQEGLEGIGAVCGRRGNA